MSSTWGEIQQTIHTARKQGYICWKLSSILKKVDFWAPYNQNCCCKVSCISLVDCMFCFTFVYFRANFFLLFYFMFSTIYPRKKITSFSCPWFTHWNRNYGLVPFRFRPEPKAAEIPGFRPKPYSLIKTTITIDSSVILTYKSCQMRYSDSVGCYWGGD